MGWSHTCEAEGGAGVGLVLWLLRTGDEQLDAVEHRLHRERRHDERDEEEEREEHEGGTEDLRRWREVARESLPVEDLLLLCGPHASILLYSYLIRDEGAVVGEGEG